MNTTTSLLPFGELNITHLFDTSALKNIGHRSTRWQIIEAFLRNAEGSMERLCEGTSGTLMMIGIPGRKNTGAFHLYDEHTRSFYMIDFEHQEMFNPLQFDAVVKAYNLEAFANVIPVESTTPVVKKVAHSGRRRNKGSRRQWGLHRSNGTHSVYTATTGQATGVATA